MNTVNTVYALAARVQDGRGHMGDDGWDHMGNGGGWMWLWGSFMMLFWLIVIGLVVWLVVRTASARGGTGGQNRSARDILAERYARGEIDGDEYEERLSRLK